MPTTAESIPESNVAVTSIAEKSTAGSPSTGSPSGVPSTGPTDSRGRQGREPPPEDPENAPLLAPTSDGIDLLRWTKALLACVVVVEPGGGMEGG